MLRDVPQVQCHHRVEDGGRALVAVLVSAGVPLETAYILKCDDVHPLVELYARSRCLAKGERTLVAELPDPPTPERPEPRSVGASAVTAALWATLALVFLWLAGALTAAVL